jgi:hypothetical protein
MTKKLTLALMLLTLIASFSHAGGKGGTELALASYGGLGVTVAKGIPLDIKFLRANGIVTYGELEFGAGFGSDLAIGAELSGGLLIGLASGISIYGGLGPAVGFGNEAEFGLGAELGLNIDVNDSSIIIEAGSHPASSYVAVGLRF